VAKLDLDFVRRQFPAFSAKSLHGQANFENAGGSYMCGQVIDRFSRYLEQRKVQPYWHYQASVEAGEEMDLAHQRLAQYLNVRLDEVMYGPSTSQNTYVLAQGFLARMKPGDSLVVSEQEHEANSGVWHRMADHGMNVKVWPIDGDTGLLNPDDLDDLLDEKTVFVTMTHCSNIVGNINDIRPIADKVHDAGSVLIVDGVSYCPHGLPDVDALGADVYMFSAYKAYGPHQGVMVIRDRAKALIEPQAHYFNHHDSKKYMVPAGPDHAQVAASNGMFDYFDAVDAHHGGADDDGRPRRVERLFHEAEVENLEVMLSYLTARNDIRLIGSADPERRAPTVTFKSSRLSSDEIARKLAAMKVMAGSGSFYALRCLQGLGVDPDDGVVRLSFVHYTSRAEIDQALSALDQIL
jgi:selenocysteine lyase/cysteine desulfurase